MLAFLLAVVIEPVVGADEPVAAPPHIFLHPSAGQCGRAAPSGEVVVCGEQERDERYRIRPIETRTYEDQPVRAATKLGNGELALHNEDKEIAPGIHSKRAMITFTLPF